MNIFRPVPGCADLYAGMDGAIVKAGYGPLEPRIYKNARYATVYIPGPGARRNAGNGTHFVHSLVAAAFLGARPDGMVVRHGPDGEFCNSVGNLCYGTQKDNIQDAIDIGLHHSVTHSNKTRCAQGHEFTSENTYVNPGTGGRCCRICRNVSRRKTYEAECAAQGKTPRPPRPVRLPK